jgi:hypothetical protein
MPVGAELDDLLVEFGVDRGFFAGFKGNFGEAGFVVDANGGAIFYGALDIVDVDVVAKIAIAYSLATIRGRRIRKKRVQRYVGCVQEPKRTQQRHSLFWIRRNYR